MLIFELINLDINAADAEQAIRILSEQCSAAGYQLNKDASNHTIPDGVLILSDTVSNTLIPPRLVELKQIAVAQITIGQAAENTSIVSHSNSLCQTFNYPHILSLAAINEMDNTVPDWLAGFATFTACIKMWRRLRFQPEQRKSGELRVNHINILAQDLNKSVDFYHRILGASYCYNLGPKKVVMELNGFDFFIEQADTVAYPPGYHFGVRSDPEGVRSIAKIVEADSSIRIVKGNGPAPGYHLGIDRVRTAFYFEDPDGLVIEIYSPEIEMLESNPHLIFQHF
ncbi:VOC family protein [Xenorhabdus thailandensis]|uniref:VOC family protein n=1 Tax=Xenorhabdus thailandensis TaxID=3136255 RepID=UPI0030F45EC9